MRSSVAVLMLTWVMLAAAALVFGQLNDDQASRTVTPGHPITAELFSGYRLAAVLSMGLLFAGCAPLFGQLVRAGWRRRDWRGLVLLTTPVGMPVLFLAVLAGTSRMVRHPHAGIGAGWFWLLAALGAFAGAGAVSGPLLTLQRLSPKGRGVSVALHGVVAAVALMGAALIATIANLATVRVWGIASFVHAPITTIAAYGVLVAAALAVASVSAFRGLTAARTR